MKIEALDKYDIPYREDTKYNRETKEHEGQGVITTVCLKLTPEDWLRACMRDNDMYMGGCCGNMSVAQDILNFAFRDGGWLDASRFRHYCELCSEHEGFEDWADVLEKDYNELDPLAKIGYIWGAVKEHLEVTAKDIPKETLDDKPSMIARRLARVAAVYGMGSFFNDDGGTWLDKQKHGQNMIDVATMFTLLHSLYDKLGELPNELWEGFGVRTKENKKITENAFGLCLFPDKDSAMEYLAEMTKYERDTFDISSLEISPCKVLKDEGLIWLEE